MKKVELDGYTREDIPTDMLLTKGLFDRRELCEWMIELETFIVPMFLSEDVAKDYYSKSGYGIKKVKVTSERKLRLLVIVKVMYFEREAPK